MDPVQRTQERIGQAEEKPASPVIPKVPNDSKKVATPSPIPGLPEGKEKTLKNGTIIPISIPENSPPGFGLPLTTDRKVLLDIGSGVNVTFNDGKLKVRANALSFLGVPLLMIFGTACLGFLLGLYLKLNQQEHPEQNVQEKPKIEKITLPSGKKARKGEEDSLRGADKLLESELELSQIYEKPSDLFDLISEEKTAIEVYEEAVRLRKMAARNNDEEQMAQAIIRLQALLRKSALHSHHRRLSAKQLWTIYHCHLKWFKSSKEIERLMKSLNKGIEPHKKVLPICPTDEE